MVAVELVSPVALWGVWMKILAVRNDNIGDLICTTPALRGLRRKFPLAQIDLVVNSYNRVVVEGADFLDKIWCYQKPKHAVGVVQKGRALLSKVELFFKIFEEKYDIAILFRGSFSPSAYQFLKASRAPIKIGVGPENLFTHPIKLPEEPLHEVELCYKIVAPLEVTPGGERCYFPLDRNLQERFRSYTPGLLLHLSSRLIENRLPKFKAHRLVQELVSEFRLPVYITGAPSDWESLKELEEDGGILIKTENLKELAAFLSLQKCFISLDGGALHLGSPIGVPTVALFGKSSPARWAPYRYRQLALKSETGWVVDIPLLEILKKVEEGLGFRDRERF